MKTRFDKIVKGASISRRRFMELGALGSAALMSGCAQLQKIPSVRREKFMRPNFLFIVTDQQGLDTLSAFDCPYVHTPNLDRLARRGVSFMESYSTNPLCSPARSSFFTGRMASETGVVINGLPIRDDIPNIGQWLKKEGYETIHVGKWHLPNGFPKTIPGFTVIPGGLSGQGTLGDTTTASVCEAYLHNRSNDKPFFLVASFLQPHDVCAWVSMHSKEPVGRPYPEIANELPELPSNFEYDPKEPEAVSKTRRQKGLETNWSEDHWRYYLWCYYRMVEEADHEIGRVLNALEDAGYADNTIVIFTSDHGEGRGRHQMVLKNSLYDEAAKVPLIVAGPDTQQGEQERTCLVSGIDIPATICDYAGIEPPSGNLGLSLRPLAEGKIVPWREFVAAEVRRTTGRMIRTSDYKYITFCNDPVEQLFDMKNDPGETRNLASDTVYAAELERHRALLKEWESRLDPGAS